MTHQNNYPGCFSIFFHPHQYIWDIWYSKPSNGLLEFLSVEMVALKPPNHPGNHHPSITFNQNSTQNLLSQNLQVKDVAEIWIFKKFLKSFW